MYIIIYKLCMPYYQQKDIQEKVAFKSTFLGWVWPGLL